MFDDRKATGNPGRITCCGAQGESQQQFPDEAPVFETPCRLSLCKVPANHLVPASTPMCSFRQSWRFFDVLCLCAFHSPRPRILSPVESTIRSLGPLWARVRGGTTTIWFRRERVVWSGALRSRLIKLSSESRNPSVWRSGRPKTTRSVNAVRIARFEYRRCPPRRPFFGGIHAVLLQGSVVEGGGLPTKGRLRSSVQLHQRASVRYVACLIHV